MEALTEEMPKTCPDCGSQDVTTTDNGRLCDLCGTRWGMTPERPAMEPGPTVPEVAAPTVTGWWALSSVELARALRRVAEGETPEAVYFSLVENSEVPGP